MKQTTVAAFVHGMINAPAETVAETITTLTADVAVTKRWVKTADLWRAAGATSKELETNTEVRDAMKRDVILLSFSKVERAIMAKPTTALTDEEKVTKRFVQQQQGSRLTRIIQYVRRAEQEELMSDEERGTRKRIALEVSLKRDLTRWIDRVEKAEAVTFSATKMLEFLKGANALLK